MRTVRISDVTIKNSARAGENALSFREKLELSKLLDRLGVSVIETGVITDRRKDGLLVKSLSTAIQSATLAVPVPVLEPDGAAFTWSCLKQAKKPRLQVSLPVSTVQMEYLHHKKPEAMLALIEQKVRECRALCEDVEFSAEDAGRSEPEFLIRALQIAAAQGANTLTVCDTAGVMLPEECRAAVQSIKKQLGGNVSLGVRISNTMYMAEPCAVAAIEAGADEVKTEAYGSETASLEKLATVLRTRGDTLGAICGVRMTELRRTVRQIEWLCRGERSKSSPFDSGVRDGEEEFTLNAHDDLAAVGKAAERLGYELTPEDLQRVYASFSAVANKKDTISAKELDVLVATAALQVPPTYRLESYVINAGNVITATSHVRLTRDGQTQDGVCVGDGPIDASFLAIEQITGTHYELDDFQIRAVTEGREAMGEAVVRLRSRGKLYSGRGISTDIVGSSIMAYINALNKIVYEETEQ